VAVATPLHPLLAVTLASGCGAIAASTLAAFTSAAGAFALAFADTASVGVLAFVAAGLGVGLPGCERESKRKSS
jgi:hypothetical protein